MPAAAAAPREVCLDWLRIAALGLLIVYHVGMFYASWVWHVKSPHSPAVAPWVEPLMRLASPWRMSLLFFVSGLALSAMLERRRPAGPGWLGQRARRLLLPVLTGVVLLVPPQSYLEVRQFHGYAGSYGEFLGLYFRAFGGFCAPDRGCLILPTWNHLWFLPYLFCYTALAAWVLRRRPQALDAAAARAPQWLAGWRLWAWPLAWLTLTRWTLRPLFGETHALVDDLYLHSQFAVIFAAGLVLARCPPLLQRLADLRVPATVALLLAWGLLLATDAGPAWRAVPAALMQAAGVAAAFGWARVLLQQDGPLRRTLSEAVFPVYLLHQTLIVVGGVALSAWALPAAVEALSLLVLTLAGSFAGYRVVRRVRWLRPWFGLPGRLPGDR